MGVGGGVRVFGAECWVVSGIACWVLSDGWRRVLGVKSVGWCRVSCVECWASVGHWAFGCWGVLDIGFWCTRFCVLELGGVWGGVGV